MSNRLDFISASTGGTIINISRESGSEVLIKEQANEKEVGFAKASPNFKEVKKTKKTKAEEDDALKTNEVKKTESDE